MHNQIDIVTEIPVFYRINNAKEHETKAMDLLTYEHSVCYVFDRGYFDLARLFTIHTLGAFLIILEKGHPDFGIVGEDYVLLDQTIRFTTKRNKGNYHSDLRRIVYYAPDLERSFVYYTNIFYLPAKDIALLYRYRWQVELFFKWIKQNLRVKTFSVESENAVKIQIHLAIITCCLIAIIEHDLRLDKPVFEVMRIQGSFLLVKDGILKLFQRCPYRGYEADDGQMELDYKCQTI